MDYANSAYTFEEFLGITERIRRVTERYVKEKNDLDLPSIQDMADELSVRLAQLADAGGDMYNEFLQRQVNYRVEFLRVRDLEEERFNTTTNPTTGKKWTEAFNRARYAAEKELGEDLRQTYTAKSLARKALNVGATGKDVLNSMSRRIGILREAWKHDLEYERLSATSSNPTIQEGAQETRKPFKGAVKDDGFTALMDDDTPTQSLADLEKEIEDLNEIAEDTGQDSMDFDEGGGDSFDDLSFLQ